MAPDTRAQVSRVRGLGEQEKSVPCHHPALLLGRRAARGDKSSQKQTWQKAPSAQGTHPSAANLIHPCSPPLPHPGTPHPSF